MIATQNAPRVLSRTERPPKSDVLGVSISATSYEEVVNTCEGWANEARRHQRPARYVCVTSVHGVMTARHDAEFRAIVNNADIVTPDGMPVVWALRSFGNREQQRVYGPDLTMFLCRRAAACGLRVYFYGATEETLQELERNLLQRFPGLQVAGRYAPPFRELTPAEDEAIRTQIREAAPDFLFVGISTPKQEKWMAKHRADFPGVVMIGVGAAFDFHAGKLRQAPPWMQRNGLEWLFRLVVEPARLWRRYFLVTPPFLPLWAMQIASQALYGFASGQPLTPNEQSLRMSRQQESE